MYVVYFIPGTPLWRMLAYHLTTISSLLFDTSEPTKVRWMLHNRLLLLFSYAMHTPQFDKMHPNAFGIEHKSENSSILVGKPQVTRYIHVGANSHVSQC